MIPSYLTFCIQQALYRPAEYVPTRLGYMVLCMGGPIELAPRAPSPEEVAA